ncbi:MAG TPA: phosphoribosylaminoimidazolesuccinocarboxamide synthase [Patescibacteria group bacterium]|nr:phosphoribosylaminoimidazolesuccinocarboxamide synthase [Patescibacteria group bacterium]
MNANIPGHILRTPLFGWLTDYLKLAHVGKVRDTFEIPDQPDKLLVVASDRVSIFDIILNRFVPKKGEVLTAMTQFWLTQALNVPNHLVAWGKDIDQFLPIELHRNNDLKRRALVVQKLQMFDKECIARGYITGTGWRDYQKTGKICGIKLPEGLHDGSKLESALFTPSTKAEQGHDENIDAAAVIAQYPGIDTATLDVYHTARDFAEQKGIIIADTKLEFGHSGNGKFVLADEVLTPDSSRFWDKASYIKAAELRRSPSGYDKQPLREAGKKAWISGNKVDISTELDPSDINDLEKAWLWNIPQQHIIDTTRRYLNIFEWLSSYSLDEYQTKFFGITNN